jgi:catechol 2,3-dioxygenase-like lactoylglutathione lyase family enzyme
VEASCPAIAGFSHIDLTVTDCRRSADWWTDVLGFVLVNQVRQDAFECMSMVHPSGLGVTVMSHDGTAPSDKFDDRRVGLDHLAFRVANADELQRWVAHFDQKGISHSGIIDIGHGPTLVFRDPDNLQLEFFVHVASDQKTERLTEADSPEARRLLAAAESALKGEA